MADEEPEKRGRGRPRKYGGTGAPLLQVRVEPDVYERVTTRPEGPRAYLQRVVRDDVKREKRRGKRATAQDES